MTYFFFYWLLKITAKLYFKKIRVYDYENVSPNKPLIICANHGNSFMDAVLMAVIFKRNLHFLARADAFNTPFKRWFLGKINMMPVYRIRDGREVVKNNDAIFDRCQQILENNGAILIFPEGNCVVEKRLRTFKTGFVQMAFASKMQNLQVLPVTINYSNPLEFYSEVSFQFQNQIDVNLIKEETQNDYISFSKLLLSKTIVGISHQMLILPEIEDGFYEQALEINLNNLKVGFVTSQLHVIKELDHMRLTDSILFEDLKIKTANYFKHLNQLNINDEVVVEGSIINPFISILVIPFYFLIKAIHYLPATLVSFIINKKIKQLQFKGAVRMILGMFVYLIYTSIFLIVSVQFLGFFNSIIFMLIFFNPYVYNRLTITYKSIRKKEFLPKLLDLRKEIIGNFNL
ncbi:hypothetical protein A5893_00090 [Pedobacter psychrophilus]|uniref:Phospholipid/glycerol acyltransferase domain-containing protein n=1 Tax=Pedobacter psychrophilus TaxID=1826909 RepID=A0A179DL76_9SPHI|nr:1-acyl-sn-glycerol-3-phosphate acyltransferase [Pedobacter psychrophilus]OAQ41552.1 hypothetical protein A5893_00090 [Pedobacter psychrophilus]